MSRTLALDIGEKRIGVAISDETMTIARGLETIAVVSIRDTISRVGIIITQYKVKEVVVGLPLNMDGSEGPAAKKAIDFAGRLRDSLPIAVSTFDERLTSRQGEAILLQADLSRKKRRLNIDRMAARIILQAYLDLKKQGGA